MKAEMTVANGQVVRIVIESDGDIEAVAFRELGKDIEVRNEGGKLYIVPKAEVDNAA